MRRGRGCAQTRARRAPERVHGDPALGVGEAFAKTLFQTNFLIRPAQGEPSSWTAARPRLGPLARLDVDPRSATRVILSHLHADHIGGLEELGFTGRFRWGQRPTLWVPRASCPSCGTTLSRPEWDSA